MGKLTPLVFINPKGQVAFEELVRYRPHRWPHAMSIRAVSMRPAWDTLLQNLYVNRPGKIQGTYAESYLVELKIDINHRKGRS